jgi:hypothetical protein
VEPTPTPLSHARSHPLDPTCESHRAAEHDLILINMLWVINHATLEIRRRGGSRISQLIDNRDTILSVPNEVTSRATTTTGRESDSVVSADQPSQQNQELSMEDSHQE